MSVDNSLWTYFIDAGIVVKFVLCILFAASILSWTLIIQRGLQLKNLRHDFEEFERRFWSGQELTQIYNKLPDRVNTASVTGVFKAGFREFIQIAKKTGKQSKMGIKAAERAMEVAIAKALDQMEANLGILATIGSTGPYIGLFGTVWGIMTAFHALGNVQQATIAMVAPGISEALVATAMGLFAAIPAVIAYNRYGATILRLENRYEIFQKEFSNILYHQIQDIE